MYRKCIIYISFLAFFLGSFPHVSASDETPRAYNQFVVYQYYLENAIDALERHENDQADRYCQLALIFAYTNEEKERVLYLRLKAARDALRISTAVQPSVLSVQRELVKSARSESRPTPPPSITAEKPTAVRPAVKSKPVIAPKRGEPTTSAVSPVSPVSPVSSVPGMPATPAVSQNTVSTNEVFKSNGSVLVVSLHDLKKTAAGNAAIQVEIGTSVILEGKNIQKFLVIDEGFISVKTLNRNQVQVDGQKWGSTFLHVWDDDGRWTIYVEVVFPKATISGNVIEKIDLLSHVQPFRFLYSNEWNSYYSGKKISDFERLNLSFQQNFGVEGETPYGFFDASTSVYKTNSITRVSTYTMGLSNIPIDGVDDFNLRLYDSTRHLTSLTLPSTSLRGIFADFLLFKENVGVSLSHGKKLSTIGFRSLADQSNDTFIDAAKFILFPRDKNAYYAFNFATGYGPGQQPHLTRHSYSVEAKHRFNNVTVGGEVARDDHHRASLAGFKWVNQKMGTALNFRDINKEFTTVAGRPGNQGVIGALWTTFADFDRLSTDTAVDVYRNRLYFNPDKEEAFNLDATGHTRMSLPNKIWNDINLNYVNTPGDLSPRTSFGVNDHLSRDFNIWSSRSMTVYVSGAYQTNRYEFSPSSAFDRYSASGGVRIPITSALSSFANYEYSWVHEPFSGNGYNPIVLNMGLYYNKPVTKKLFFNSSLIYRNELGNNGTNSFLSGQDSVSASAGFSYNPVNDVSFFVDGQWRNVWSKTEISTYNDLSIRVGMRMALGPLFYWDPSGTVAGFVFKDKNADKIFNARDKGIPGVKVKVGDKEVVTDARGLYSVHVSAKSVMVAPVFESLPHGLIFSTPTFLKADIGQNKITRVDFGLISQTGIYGVVFVDKNSNGIPDGKDQFVSQVKLVLDDHSTQKTNPQGVYSFRDIGEGEHTIALDINSIPIEMVPLIKMRNEVNVQEGSTYVFHVPLKIKEQAELGKN